MELWKAYADLSITLAALAVWCAAAVCRRVDGEAGPCSREQTACCTPADPRTSTMLERSAFRRVMLPAFPGVLMISFLSGWAFREPDPADEHLGPALFFFMGAALIVLLRALVRALSSLLAAYAPSSPVVTVGLLRCRVIVADAYRNAASATVLDAALSHEAAHAKARDPLRIWLLQFVTDLQWPIPAARRRMQDWLFALELLRDDDAVAAGTCPTDLAESILLAARLRGSHAAPAAGICGDGSNLALRIRRLLADDVRVRASHEKPASYTSLFFCFALCGASLLGALYGELVLAMLPGVQ